MIKVYHTVLGHPVVASTIGIAMDGDTMSKTCDRPKTCPFLYTFDLPRGKLRCGKEGWGVRGGEEWWQVRGAKKKRSYVGNSRSGNVVKQSWGDGWFWGRDRD